MVVDGVSAGGWKLVNLFEQGFYRVLYSEEMWEAILRQLNEDHTVGGLTAYAHMRDVFVKKSHTVYSVRITPQHHNTVVEWTQI